jgi:hypothetical protein
MALDPNINTREAQKFRDAGAGLTRVAVSIEEDLVSSGSIIAQMLTAEDRQDTFTWLDAGTIGERVSTIVTISPSVTSQTLTTTFTYTAAGPWYVVATKTRVLA